MDELDGIDELAQDWLRHLRATNRSPRTITIYRGAVTDLALIRLLLDTGARPAEVLTLKITDLEFEHNTAWVVGKGHRP